MAVVDRPIRHARAEERGHVPDPRLDMEAQHPFVERERPVEIGHPQMHTADPRARRRRVGHPRHAAASVSASAWLSTKVSMVVSPISTSLAFSPATMVTSSIPIAPRTTFM